jgi:hypothetical protein
MLLTSSRHSSSSSSLQARIACHQQSRSAGWVSTCAGGLHTREAPCLAEVMQLCSNQSRSFIMARHSGNTWSRRNQTCAGCRQITHDVEGCDGGRRGHRPSCSTGTAGGSVTVTGWPHACDEEFMMWQQPSRQAVVISTCLAIAIWKGGCQSVMVTLSLLCSSAYAGRGCCIALAVKKPQLMCDNPRCCCRPVV